MRSTSRGRARRGPSSRVSLRALAPGHGKTIIVRVNGIGTPHFEADLDAIVGPGLDIVNLPKPESGDDVRACAEALMRSNAKIAARR